MGQSLSKIWEGFFDFLMRCSDAWCFKFRTRTEKTHRYFYNYFIPARQAGLRDLIIFRTPLVLHKASTTPVAIQLTAQAVMTCEVWGLRFEVLHRPRGADVNFSLCALIARIQISWSYSKPPRRYRVAGFFVCPHLQASLHAHPTGLFAWSELTLSRRTLSSLSASYTISYFSIV